MLRFIANAGLAKMRNHLKPLKKTKAKYDKDMLNLLSSEMVNTPGIKNTKEIQRCFQRMAHEYAETNYPKILRKSTKCRRHAGKLWRWFVGMYPKIADYFSGVKYKMCGGYGDPRGRYIIIPTGQHDEWLAGPYNRNLFTVLKQKAVKHNRLISDRGIPHQTFTKVKKDCDILRLLQERIKDAPPKRIRLYRSSGYTGHRKYCHKHGCPSKFPKPIYSFKENDILNVAFCYSARKGDLLECMPLLKELLILAPTEILFETEERVGREYADDTIKLLRIVGFKVTIENKKEKHESGWQHPPKSPIQTKNKALNGHYLVPESHIKGKWR